MKIENDGIQYQAERFIYWTRIYFASDDNAKKSLVLTGASREYLNDLYRLPSKNDLTNEHLNKWVKSVIDKWEALGDELFKHSIHFDAYANTPEGEANTTDYLLSLAKGK